MVRQVLRRASSGAVYANDPHTFGHTTCIHHLYLKLQRSAPSIHRLRRRDRSGRNNKQYYVGLTNPALHKRCKGLTIPDIPLI